MVYLTKTFVKGKTYWILAHSSRDRGKVVKRVKYVGSKKPNDEELESMKIDFLAEMGRDKRKTLTFENALSIIKGNVWHSECAPAVPQFCLGFTHGYLGLGKVFGIRGHTVEILVGQQNIYLESSIKKERNEIFDIMKGRGLKYLESKYSEWRKKISVLISEYKKGDDARPLDDEKLIEMYKRFIRLDIEQWSFSLISESSDDFSETGLIIFMREHLSKKGIRMMTNDLSEALIWLTRYDELSFIEREHLDFLRICWKTIKEGEKGIKAMLEDHAKRYYWVTNSYAGAKFLREKDFMDLVRKKTRKTDVARIEEEISLLENKIGEIRKKRASYIRELKLDRKTVELLDMMCLFGRINDERKETMLRSVAALHLILHEIARRNKIPVEEIVYYSPTEIDELMENSRKIGKDEISRRMASFVLVATSDDPYIDITFSGNKAAMLIKALESTKAMVKDIRGFVASSGGMERHTSRVSIIMNPYKQKFRPGDILVATMTRPEFVPLMRAASGIITDEGGVTCHAAIVARELGIPCIIGTGAATKILKTGDIVSMNMRHGLVERIK